MSIDATHDRTILPAAPAGPLIHPLWVRVTHWVNALAMLVMICFGLAGLQRVAAVCVHVPERDHAWRLARRRAALAFCGDVDRGSERARLCRARYRHRPLPPQAIADPPAVTSSPTRARAQRPSRARRPRGLQRCTETPLSRRHPGRRRDRPVWPLDLEIGAAAEAHRVVRRLRCRALRAFLRHGRDRRLPGRAYA